MAHVVLVLIVLVSLLLGNGELVATHVALANHCRAFGEILECVEFSTSLSPAECNLAVATALLACGQ